MAGAWHMGLFSVGPGLHNFQFIQFTVEMSEEIDKHVLKRYDVGQKLGKGAYGIVWKSIDKKSQKLVALKKVYDAFQVKYVQNPKTHQNILSCSSVPCVCMRRARSFDAHVNAIKIHTPGRVDFFDSLFRRCVRSVITECDRRSAHVS